MKSLERYVPWAAGALALVSLLVVARPPAKVDGIDLDAFSRIPVLEGGRVKPLDTVARNSLLMIRSKQSVPLLGADGKALRTLSADEWLAEVLFRPPVADQLKIFRIDDPEVLGLLGIQQGTDPYYPFAALQAKLPEIERQGGMAQGVEAKLRSRFQSAMAVLYERVLLYYRLKNTVQLDGTPGLAWEISARADANASQRHDALASMAVFRALPPAVGTTGDQGWHSTGEALRGAGAGGAALDPALEPLAAVGLAYASRDAANFNRGVEKLLGLAAAARPEALGQTTQEIRFNRAEPFYLGIVIYVLALLTLFTSWLWAPRILQPAAYGLICAGAIVHTLGLAFRIIIQGRPPVTNLYSSAVFVGWGAVLLGIIIEWIYRKGFGTLVASAVGVATLIVAHNLTGDGDTMEMMRAVLDNNFWLGTHVLTITIGYSGTFLAGAIAIGWALRQHLAPSLDPATTKTLSAMTYGVICFALFFSFIGTVLGGIWADQSWGRFWGWDPKENGALLIVLWNAIILHARWGRYAADRGVMAMAIFGNVITACSWFGVNMLGVGLHSYGFMDSAFYALTAFCVSQLLLMGLALLPREFFRRGYVRPPAEPQPQAGK
jgi:ABC-type transport system involved in cytochrome c biogenesis permease subunit